MNRLNGLNRINRLNGPPKGGGISWSSYWETREPSGISVTQADTTATVTWTDSAVLGADGYKVYAGETLKATVAAGTQSANVTGLTELTEYVFKVVAYKGAEESTGITLTKTTYRYRYVRPLGGSYGAENGSSYAAAWNGFADITWAEIVPNTVLWICGTHNEALTVSASGTSDLHIIFRGDYPADAGVIDGTDSIETTVMMAGRDFTEWSNLTVLQATTSCIYFAGGTHWMYDCEITDSGDQNTEVNTGGLVYLTRCTIERGADDGCSAHDTGRYIINDCDLNDNGMAFDSTSTGLTEINDSRFIKTGVNGANYIARRCSFLITTSNPILAAGTGTLVYCLLDIRAYSVGLAPVIDGNVNLDNCTVIGNNTGYIRKVAGTTKVLKNCILYDLNRIGSSEVGVLNLVNCNKYSSGVNIIDSNIDEITGDPLFTNLAGGDFTLQVGSPCRGAGVTGLGYTEDYAGNPVPLTGIDVGCYQSS